MKKDVDKEPVVAAKPSGQKRVNFADDDAEKAKLVPKITAAEPDAWDDRGFILTDETHNDLLLLHDYTVHSFFQAEESLTYGVFYLRKKARQQKSLLESQEESLGIKKTNAGSDKQSENTTISDLLQRFERRHQTMKTYGLEYYQNMESDEENNIKDFKTIFNIDFTNLIFNVLILIIMVVQLFLYLDSNTALLRQAWANNQNTNPVNTLTSIKTDMLKIVNQSLNGSKLV